MQRKELEKSHADARFRRSQTRRENKMKAQEEAEEKARMDKQLKRGDGTPEKKVRCGVDGQTNPMLNDLLDDYINVDDNIVTVRHKQEPY